MQFKSKSKTRITPIQIIVIGFALVVLMGSILLKMPISSKGNIETPFVDCIFTSTSAVCVTGLVTVDTGTHWSYFGKTVIIMLIQIGGLGFMCFATLFSLLLGKKIGFHERIIMKESMNFFTLQGVVKTMKSVLKFTVTIELIGALILSTQFIPQFGVWKGIYYSLFHSISAFCNAGFDLFGNFSSLTSYASNTVVIGAIGSLIILGGLGFTVIKEIYNYRVTKKISMYSKFIISITIGLVVIGAILMLVFEFNNPGTIKNMTFKDKILSSTFASITPRTAGYNSISTVDMTAGGKLLTMLLMFIGGSPGSTAGGLKTATVGLIFMTGISVIKGREDTEIFKKRIDRGVVNRAITVILVSSILVVSATMLLSVTEVKASAEQILYECISAFATVGLTLGLTTELSFLGKLIISFTMFAGRVGVLTLVLAFAQKESPNTVKYSEGKFLIG